MSCARAGRETAASTRRAGRAKARRIVDSNEHRGPAGSMHLHGAKGYIFLNLRETAMPNKPRLFTRFAKHAAHFTGTPLAFVLAVLIIVVWACTGPMFQFG